MNNRIDSLLSHYCDELNYNPAKTTIHTLKDLYDIKIHPQVFHGSLGFTADEYLSSEGIKTGALIFLGVYLVQIGLTDEQAEKASREFAGILKENNRSNQCEVFDSVLEDRNGLKCEIRNTVYLVRRFLNHLENEWEEIDLTKASIV